MRRGDKAVRLLGVAGLTTGLFLAGAGCGADTPTAATPSTAAPGPGGTVDYDKLVPDSEVTKGLAAVRLHAARVQAVLPAEGVDAAKKAAAEMQDAWYEFEATVRRNEKTLYLQMEDALADVNGGARDNRPERVARGLQQYDEASQAYLEKHP
jgi:hypothetical protein